MNDNKHEGMHRQFIAVAKRLPDKQPVFSTLAKWDWQFPPPAPSNVILLPVGIPDVGFANHDTPAFFNMAKQAVQSKAQKRWPQLKAGRRNPTHTN